ncbi:MAG: transcriptional regulator [Acidimicrobiia bacterium]
MTSGPSAADEFRVLHTIRCVGFAGEDRVAAVSGLDSGHTLTTLRALTERGLLSRLEGVFGGWGLTDEGRVADADWVLAELEAADARGDVEAAYGEFLGLNPKLLQICSDWQMLTVAGTSILNDHRDPDYDAGVVDRLIKLDRSAQRILESLCGRLSRFGSYRNRLTANLERVMAGETDRLADNLDSYHTVWFHLHEDLLATLGRERGFDR